MEQDKAIDSLNITNWLFEVTDFILSAFLDVLIYFLIIFDLNQTEKRFDTP